MEFKYKLVYREGHKQGLSDALSRREEFSLHDLDKRVTQQILPLLNKDIWHEREERDSNPSQDYGEHINSAETTTNTIGEDSMHESMEETLSQTPDSEIGSRDIQESVRLIPELIEAIKQDEEFAKILKDPEQAEKRGLTVWKGLVFQKGRLMIPHDTILQTRIISARHDAPLAGHRGITKTMQLVARDYTWPGLKTSVRNFVQTCDTCNRTKRTLHKPYGLLQPLPTPEKPWSSISMDFVMPLPQSGTYDAILVVVDRLTKMAHYIPTNTTITAEGTAGLILAEVVRLHGIPQEIISDRGSVFTSRVWETICEELKITRKLSTAFHPESDGQTERVNQIMEQYLRAYCNYAQDNWRGMLPYAEFAYNNAESATTNVSPFAANYGFNPAMDLETEWNPVERKEGSNLLNEIRNIQRYLKQEIQIAQRRYKRNADFNRIQEPEFTMESKVWLSTDHIKTTRPMKKLDYQWIGPFRVLAKVGNTSYRLELPATMRIHDVFHVSKLKRYEDQDAPPRVTKQPALPIVVEDQEYHRVEHILDCKRHGRSNQYLVHWEHYGIDDRTWEPYRTLVEDVPELLADYHRRHPGKPRPEEKTR